MGENINPKKVDLLNSFKEFLGEKENFFFLNYRGLTVVQLTELRRKVERENATLKVVSNNIMKKAFHAKNVKGVDDYLVGPTAVVAAQDEANNVAKVVYEFVGNTKLEVKGGFVLGEVYSKEQVSEFSKLPTRKEAISLFISLLKAPMSKFVRTLQALADIRD